jgi:hypothetical protein
MIRRLTLVWVGLLSACSLSLPAQAQELADVLAKVKSAIVQKDSCWELKRAENRNLDDSKASEQDWVCGNQVVGIYYYQQPSIEAAGKLLQEIITSPVQAAGQTVPSPKIGDESSIRTYTEYSTSSYVFFRRGNIVVRIDSNLFETTDRANTLTLKNAIDFAKIVDDQILQNRAP